VTLNTAFAGKCLRYDTDPEMRLAFRPMAGVTRVKMGLVDDLKAVRLECLGEFLLDLLFDRHDAAILA
jgi:hypothetical protein